MRQKSRLSKRAACLIAFATIVVTSAMLAHSHASASDLPVRNDSNNSAYALAMPTDGACVAPPSSLVAWYTGDGTANDIIAGHNGVLAWYNRDDGYWYPSDGQKGATFAPGMVGQAFSFDGVNAIVQVPGRLDDPLGSSPFTIAFWAKFNSTDFGEEGLQRTFISSNYGGWVFWYEIVGSGPDSGNGILHFSYIDSSGEKPPVVSFEHWIPQPGQWYHLAVTRNGDTYTLFIDGLPVRSANDPHGPLGLTDALTIGSDRQVLEYFNGLLDEIGIYKSVLSAEEIQAIFNAGSYGQCKTSSFTGSGSNVIVQTDAATLTFDNVSIPGTTSVSPIDPATVGQVPGGFAVSNSVAYDISTTAAFTGLVTLAFKVPGPISEEDFNNLAIFHNVNGTLVDVTAITPARDYSTLIIYASTDSFSPFYLARRGPHIKTLFDQTKAHKSGSTIPIKLQILSAGNSNLSSSSTALVTRDLRFMGGNTLAPVMDSGNANPDYTFRYDPMLGGAGGGYIFNLSTKRLASGQYVLSFYVGSDRSFLSTLKFEIK